MNGNFGFERLRGRENYSEWKVGARAYLTSKCYFNECIVKLPAADATTPPTATQRTTNQKALAELTLLLDPSLYSYIEHALEAKEAWDALTEVFEDKGAIRKVFLLKQWISLKCDDCTSMHEYVNKNVSIRSKVKNAGFDISDEIAGCILLCGLGEDYNPLIMSMEAKETITLDSVKNMLLQSIEVNNNSSENAMSVKKFNKRDKKKNVVKCYECGGPHYKNKCPKLQKKSEKGDIVLWTMLDAESERSELISQDNFSADSDDTVLYSALAAQNDHHDDEWFIDSGATKHMTKVAHNMQNVKQPSVKQVKAANGEKIDILKTGDIKCTVNESNLTLRDVQYIPKLCVNLLSVSQIVMNGNTVIFDMDGCRILSKDKKVMAKGELVDGMFKMQIRACESVFSVKHSKSDENSILWHRRLGHVSFNTLKSLMKIPVSGDMKCVVCAEGKHARSPFSENGTRATKLLGIIHTDVCGPFPVQSLGGAKYFVSFIDDYSRRVCIYPLKSKAEVFSKFVAYKKMVENQLESTIKIVRSDNGTEYVNKNFEQLFAECGIKHEKSTPHSPQQNGLSERMNRTILEKTRCMLLDSRLPKHFWAEAAQAAVNVINTLPNSPNGAAPDEMWYNKKCNLKHFRVFGSKAMVWKPNMKRGKLDAKSFECIYLRRADDAKAFRLYDKNARKIVISHDVIFMENEAKVIDSNCVTKSSEVFIENDECFDEISDVEEITISTVSDVSAPAATGENDNSVSSNADDVNNTLVTDNQNERKMIIMHQVHRMELLR